MNWIKRLFGRTPQLPKVPEKNLRDYSHDEIKRKLKQDKLDDEYHSHFGSKYSYSEPDWNWDNSDFLHEQNKKTNTYPKWKHLIPETPTLQDYENAFTILFGFHPDKCEVQNNNGVYIVKTPTTQHYHGGMGYHTETPKTNEIYYTGCGCTWSIDDNGDRYYLIDYQDNLPYRWLEVQAKEIIHRFTEWYMIHGQNKLRENKLKRILGDSNVLSDCIK